MSPREWKNLEITEQVFKEIQSLVNEGKDQLVIAVIENDPRAPAIAGKILGYQSILEMEIE
ncbi:MAG: hypothetical protein ACRDBG_12960 [Waterburya sp.]